MPTYLGWGITFPVVWAVDVRAEGVCFPVIGLILLLLRFNARRWQRARVGADDVFAVLAWARLPTSLLESKLTSRSFLYWLSVQSSYTVGQTLTQLLHY